MPTQTYIPIASTTLASPASGAFFNAFDGYRDLIIVVNGTMPSSSASLFLQLNGLGSTSIYTTVFLAGNGTASDGNTYALSNQFRISHQAGWNSTSHTMSMIQFSDYASTTKQKSILVRNSNSTNAVEMGLGRANITGPITSIYVWFTSGSFATGTTFSVYGII